MDFSNNFNNLAPPSSVNISLIGARLPNNTHLYFRAKQKEIVNQYSAARLFLKETECIDWEHWFVKDEDDAINETMQNALKSYFYEAALFYYNILVDLSWTLCYVAAEYSINHNGERISFVGMKSIEEAAELLRKAEGMTTNPTAETNPFEYLKTMSPEYTEAIDLIIAFWKDFGSSDIRRKYNYCKHKGKPCYSELQKAEGGRLFRFYIIPKGEDAIQVASDTRDVQWKISLNESIEELRNFDDNILYPYLLQLIKVLEETINTTQMLL